MPRADLAASFTEAVVGGIAKKVEAALLQTGTRTLVMAGGVAANSHLRRRLTDLCRRLGVRFVVPPLPLCGDNGAMVAAAGFFEYQNGNFATPALNASAADEPLA